MSVKESFGDRLRRLRGDMNQKELGDILGISRASVGYYENGTRTPDIEVLEKVARHFKVSTDYLLGLTAYPTPDEQVSAKSTMRLMDEARKKQIEELTKMLVECWINHHTKKLFPLWYEWVIQHQINSVESLNKMMENSIKNMPPDEFGPLLTEISLDGSMLMVNLARTYRKHCIENKIIEDDD